MTETTIKLAAMVYERDLEKAASMYVQGVPIVKIAELCPEGMDKQAFLAAAARLIPGVLRGGAKLLGRGAKGAVKAPGKVGRFARSPLKTTGRWAMRKPMSAAMLGMTAMEGVGSARKGYRQYSAATQGGRFGAKARQFMAKQHRINPTPQYAQISGF